MNLNYQTISLSDAAQIIIGDVRGCIAGDYEDTNTYLLVGEPGIGKTSLRTEIGEALGMKPLLFDAPSSSIEDLLMFIPDRESHTMRAYLREDLDITPDRPVFIVIDEFTKATPAMQAQLHPLLTAPRRLGSVYLHPHSVVVLTGNLSSDKVGDRMQGHTARRIIRLEVQKPTGEEWVNNYATRRGLHPVVSAFIDRRPEMFASYRDAGFDAADNPYPYDPKTHGVTGTKCVTPSGMEQVSRECFSYSNGHINKPQFSRAVEGAIGQHAGAEFAAFFDLADEIPSPKQIQADPLNAQISTNSSAMTIVVMSALTWAQDHALLVKWCEYFKRMETTHQTTYVLMAQRNEDLFKKITSVVLAQRTVAGERNL